MYQEGSWSDVKDDAVKTLHIGKLEYKTKYGKKGDYLLLHVYPRDVKSALCLVEQTKVANKISNSHGSHMKLVKMSAINKALHANSFGKVSVFSSQIT
jgi:hypothetical protein